MITSIGILRFHVAGSLHTRISLYSGGNQCERFSFTFTTRSSVRIDKSRRVYLLPWAS